MSVNVSACQLQHPGFADEVAGALADGPSYPSSLVLEITESVLVNDTEGTLERLAELKRLGIRLALDDFGTGYSSLSYLRRFPVDLLKIDRSFVSALGTRTEVPLIIEAIITLGDALGLDSVAEGVEQIGRAQCAAYRRVPIGAGLPLRQADAGRRAGPVPHGLQADDRSREQTRVMTPTICRPRRAPMSSR